MKELTLTEAAKRIGVDRSTLFRWTQAGKVAAKKLPHSSQLLFDERTVRDLVSRRAEK